MRLKQFEGVGGMRDQFQIDPRTLKVRPDFNIRDLTTPVAREKLDVLKAQIKAEGVLEALEIEWDGETPWINEGHRRHIVVMELIEDGHEFKTIPCIQERTNTNEGKRALHMLMRKKEDYEPLEYAKGVYRLVHVYGWDRGELAGVLGCTKQTIDNHLKTDELPEPIKEHVRKEDISATTARNLAKTDLTPEQQDEMIRKNKEENAKIKGKDKSHKVTAKTLKRGKPDKLPIPARAQRQGELAGQTAKPEVKDEVHSQTPAVVAATPEPLPAFSQERNDDTPISDDRDQDIVRVVAPPAKTIVDGFNRWTPQIAAALTQRHATNLLAALKPFADLCTDFDANAKADDDIVEVLFADIKKAWSVYTATTGGQEEEAA